MKKTLTFFGIACLILSGLLTAVPVKATDVIEVWIDIKPGSCPNSINPNSKGVIPVAIITTLTFDATDVDPGTVVFSDADAVPLRWTLEDVMTGDGDPPDGKMDLLLFFKTQECSFSGYSATLTGNLFDGTPIEGTGSINLVPKGKP